MKKTTTCEHCGENHVAYICDRCGKEIARADARYSVEIFATSDSPDGRITADAAATNVATNFSRVFGTTPLLCLDCKEAFMEFMQSRTERMADESTKRENYAMVHEAVGYCSPL